MSTAFVIIGFILIFAGIISYGIMFKKKFYNQKDEFNVEILKKNILYLVVPGLLFLLGFIFVTICYYINPYILNYFTENSITVSTLDNFMIYFGEIMFVICLFSFLTCLFFRMYLSKNNKKLNLIIRIIQYVTAVGAVGFFLMYMQGQAAYLIYPLANVIVFCKDGIILVNSNSQSSYISSLSGTFHFQVALYALFIIGGACLVFYICDHKMYKEYGHHGLITTCFFIAFPCGILGARAWYVIGNWTRDGFDVDPLKIFRVWEGGLAIMGGAVFGIIAGITVMIVYKIKSSRYKPIDYLLLVDIIVPTILVAQAIGRTGNFFNNEVHGDPVSIEYFNWLPTFIKNNMHYTSAASSGTLDANHIYVPLFFIEAIVNLCGYFFIEYGIKNLFGFNYYKKHNYHADGSLVGWYIAWYGATRAVLEPMRDVAYNMGKNNNFSNVSAYVMIGIGLFIVLVCVVLKILNEKGIFKYQWQKYAEKVALEDKELSEGK